MCVCGGGVGEHGHGISVMKEREMGVMLRDILNPILFDCVVSAPATLRALCLTILSVSEYGSMRVASLSPRGESWPILLHCQSKP